MGSQRCPVNSGVPQGSVFGPTLFLCYIDDLPDMLSCKVSIYADDTLLYQTVNCPEDAVVFQENINAVYKWARLWKMPFNDIKCLAINFGKVRPVVQYKPHVLPGPKTQNTLQSNLTFNLHIAETSLRSKKILGRIKHPMHNALQDAKLLVYTSLCRPILEYADVVWDRSVS